MKKLNLFPNPVMLLVIICIGLLPSFAKAQNCDMINARQLREMIVQLGYTVKDLNSTDGSEMFEVKLNTNGFDVPISYSLTSNKNYIWLTVSLGTPRQDTSVINIAMLKEQSVIQPCQFYVTAKGALMMGLAVENRGVTNAVLRRQTDKIATEVAASSRLWVKK